MADYVGLYFESDETEVSPEGVYTNAIGYELRADLDEVGEPIELFLEASEGYIITDTEIFISGASADMWRLALLEEDLSEAVWGASLPVAGTVEHGILNRIPIFIQAKATSEEWPAIDVSVLIYVGGIASPAPEEE